MNPARRHPRSFTLLEIVVATSVMSILSVAIGSVILLASRALPSARGPTETTITATAALDQLVADLRVATSVTAATATSITFTVPDRTGDTVEDTVACSWAGAGSPIIRTFNGDAGSPLLASASAFALSYRKRTVNSTQTTTVQQDSGELLFSSFAGWAGITPTISTNGLSPTSWASEAFTIDKVTIPSDATRLYISRVSLRIGHTILASPNIFVSICVPAGSGNPVAGAQVGSSYTVSSGLLAIGPGWQDAVFSDVSFTDTTVRNLVILCKASVSGGQIEYLTSSSAPTDAYTFLNSTDSGATWLPSSNRNRNDSKFFVYGGYVRPVQTTVTATTYCLGSVDVTLQPSADASTRLDTGFSLLNQPQVPGP